MTSKTHFKMVRSDVRSEAIGSGGASVSGSFFIVPPRLHAESRKFTREGWPTAGSKLRICSGDDGALCQSADNYLVAARNCW